MKKTSTIRVNGNMIFKGLGPQPFSKASPWRVCVNDPVRFSEGGVLPRGGAPCCGAQNETAAGDVCPRRRLPSVL